MAGLPPKRTDDRNWSVQRLDGGRELRTVLMYQHCLTFLQGLCDMKTA